MKAVQFTCASMWIVVMWMLSTSNTEFLLTFGTAITFLIVWYLGGDNNEEPIKARKIIIKYNDGNKQEVMGTKWERYDDVVAIYNNELEDNSVLEINLDSMRSIGFA